jgi:glycosyltransferase involved in cell wall biosynthesis
VRLLEDAELRRRIGRAAREYAREQFSWERFQQETMDAYATALGSGGAR